MATKVVTKTAFEARRVIQPIYTGGSLSLDYGGRLLATSLGEDALITDLETGKELARIEGDGEAISTLTLTPSASHLIICSRSLSVRIYALKPTLSSSFTIATELLRTLKPHTTPVVVLAVDQTSTLLATGAADGVVKVWDIRGGFVTHTFRGPNVLISALHFFELVGNNRLEETSKKGRKSQEGEAADEVALGFRLASGSQDGKVRIWDLYKRSCTSVLDSHVSDVRALDYSPEENVLMTASRDKTVMWWDAMTWKIRKVVPVFEEIEGAGFLNSGAVTYTGGANGRIRLWKTGTGQEMTHSQTVGEGIIGTFYTPELPFILSVHSDQVLILHSTANLDSPLPQLKRISGTHDEIIDLAYLLPDRSLLALATNTEELRIVSLESTYFGADVAQLKGHEDIIICLDVDWSGHWIATGAKDNTARLWRVDPAGNSFACFATFTGHAESLGAIGLPHFTPQEDSAAFKRPLDHPPPYLLTGSQDRTVKRWDVRKSRASYTRKAHDKDINAIDVNYDGRLFASASQDRTVKIWSVEDGEVQGVLRGHRRGVWSVKFSPKDKGLVATGSGDKTVKIWNLSDYSCLRTFEGHTNNVLKVAWLGSGIVSAGGDGLVKVWDATGEVECTLDNHEDRVWALAVHPDNTIVSGSADSTVTFWADITAQTAAASTAAATKFVEEEQTLQNYIHAGSYREAITLALQLNHPGRLLTLFTFVIPSPQMAEVDTVLANLADEQLFNLLLRLRDWNTNARTAPVAQRILWTLMKSYPPARLAGLRGVKEVVDGLLAYTERHYRRMEELADESYLVEYTLREIDGLDVTG